MHLPRKISDSDAQAAATLAAAGATLMGHREETTDGAMTIVSELYYRSLELIQKTVDSEETERNRARTQRFDDEDRWPDSQ